MRSWPRTPKTAKPGSRLAALTKLLQSIRDRRDAYRPERHYMRGPGPKALAKHRPNGGL